MYIKLGGLVAMIALTLGGILFNVYSIALNRPLVSYVCISNLEDVL